MECVSYCVTHKQMQQSIHTWKVDSWVQDCGHVFKTKGQGASRKTLYLVFFGKNHSLSFPMHHRNSDATLQACKYDG